MYVNAVTVGLVSFVFGFIVGAICVVALALHFTKDDN